MAKKRSTKIALEDIYYPVPADTSLSVPSVRGITGNLQTQFIRQALRAAFKTNEPSEWEVKQRGAKALVTPDEIELVTNLIQSLEPRDSIETALAIQFTVTYIHGMKDIRSTYDGDRAIVLFEFGHKALDMIQRYRNKGMQQVNVQYNVNRGQVVNIKTLKTHPNSKKANNKSE